MSDSELQFAIVSSSLLFLLLIGSVVLVFVVSARRQLMQQAELAETRLNFERELRLAEAEISEEVMSRFARELHDNVGQMLTAMHIHIENQKIDHPASAESFQTLGTWLSEVTQQLRLMSRTLNNDFLGHLGLVEAIRLESERLSALRRFNVALEPVQGQPQLEKDQELIVFRIFQEIAQNALRHSDAANLTISISGENGLELRVSDDGKGFDRQQALLHGKGSGLRNILKRAHLAGLICEIESSPGKGSLFVLKKVSTLV